MENTRIPQKIFLKSFDIQNPGQEKKKTLASKIFIFSGQGILRAQIHLFTKDIQPQIKNYPQYSQFSCRETSKPMLQCTGYIKCHVLFPNS